MKKVAGTLKLIYSQYRELQSFAQFGSDLDADTKSRLALGERIVAVLKQGRNSPVRPGCMIAVVYAVINGYLNSIEVKDISAYETQLYALLEQKYLPLLERLESGSYDDNDVEEIKKALSEIQR